MTLFLAFAGRGRALGPTGSFIGAGITLLLCIYSTVSLFNPSIRGRWGRGGKGGRMSAIGCAAWAICEAAWSLCLFCHGIGYQLVERNAMPILLTAFIILFCAAIRDSIYFKRPAKSAMKSFHVYLKEPPAVLQKNRTNAEDGR